MTRKVKIMIAVPLAMVAVVALFAVVGLVSRGGTSADSTAGTPGAATMSSERAATESVPEPVMGSDAGAAGKSTSGGAADGQDFAAAVPPASAPSAHYLLRTGDLSLLVKRGTLLPTVDRIKSMTTAMGGYVMSSAVGSQAGGPVEPMPLDAPVASDGEHREAGHLPERPLRLARRPRPRAVLRDRHQALLQARRRPERLDVQRGRHLSVRRPAGPAASLPRRRAPAGRVPPGDDDRQPDAGRAGPHRPGAADHRGALRPAQVAAGDHHLRRRCRSSSPRRTRRRRRSTPATPSAARSGTPSICSATAPASRRWC